MTSSTCAICRKKLENRREICAECRKKLCILCKLCGEGFDLFEWQDKVQISTEFAHKECYTKEIVGNLGDRQ